MGIRVHDSKGMLVGRCLPVVLSAVSSAHGKLDEITSILLEVSFHTFKVAEVCTTFEDWINVKKVEIIGHEYTKENDEDDFRVESFHDYLPYERTVKYFSGQKSQFL